MIAVLFQAVKRIGLNFFSLLMSALSVTCYKNIVTSLEIVTGQMKKRKLLLWEGMALNFLEFSIDCLPADTEFAGSFGLIPIGFF